MKTDGDPVSPERRKSPAKKKESNPFSNLISQESLRWLIENFPNARVLTSNEACCPCTYRADECPSNPKPNCLWTVTPTDVLQECESILRS